MKKKLIAVLSAAVIGLSLVPGANAMATTSTSQTSSQAKKNALPEIKTTPMSQEETDAFIKQLAKKAKDLKSFDIKAVANVDMQGMTMAFKGNLSLDIVNKALTFNSNIMGQELNAIVKDGVSYFKDESGWTKYEIDKKILDELDKAFKQANEENSSQAANTDKFFKYYEAGKAEDGTVVFKNKEKLTGKQLADMMTVGVSNAASNTKEIEAAKKQIEDADLEMDLMVVYDKDSNIKQFVIAMDMSENGEPAKFILTLNFENINNISEIVVPEEAKNAKLIPTNTSSNTSKAN